MFNSVQYFYNTPIQTILDYNRHGLQRLITKYLKDTIIKLFILTKVLFFQENGQSVLTKFSLDSQAAQKV